MAGFLNPLDVRLLDDSSSDGRGSWQLLGDVAFQSDVAGRTILAPAGFITDFASVPKWPLAYALYGGRAPRASIPHDLLYTTKELPRDVADAVFHEAMLCTGVPPDIAWMMYEAVRLGGGAAWDADGQKQAPRVEKWISAAQLEAA